MSIGPKPYIAPWPLWPMYERTLSPMCLGLCPHVHVPFLLHYKPSLPIMISSSKSKDGRALNIYKWLYTKAKNELAILDKYKMQMIVITSDQSPRSNEKDRTTSSRTRLTMQPPRSNGNASHGRSKVMAP